MVAGRLTGITKAGRGDNGRQLREREVEILVDEDVVEFRSVGDFAPGRQEPAVDHLFRVLATLMEALCKGIDRWWQDENPNGVGKGGLYLTRALPVDLEQDIVTLSHRLLDPDA